DWEIVHTRLPHSHKIIKNRCRLSDTEAYQPDLGRRRCKASAMSGNSSAVSSTSTANWRSPLVIVISGCLIGMLTFGPRSTFGFFLQPMSTEFSWGRDVFALAFAVQNLLWGIAQPFAGAVADRFGTVRVIAGGALLYAIGLVLMRHASTPLLLEATSGVLIGFGLSGCSFNLVVAAFGKVVPPRWRAVALGAGTAAGSFGQFLFA